MCALLVGLPDVNVIGIEDDDGQPLRVHVETTTAIAGCAECGTRAWSKGRRRVELVDLAAFGRPAVLVWHKRRWCCPDASCEIATFTEAQPAIAAARAGVTDRAGRWMCRQVGRGRSVSAVADELGCDWHTVMDAVVAYGTPLIEDPARIGEVTALGLDETLFVREGPWNQRSWVTSIVDVTQPAQLLDIVEDRTAKAPSDWLEDRSQPWRDAIEWAVLDLSGPYRKTFGDSLPDATLVADPFHVVKLANTRLDDVRRRTQQDTLGHRGHRDDPLYRSRRLLTKAHERLDEKGNAKLLGLLEAGDPKGEVRMAWTSRRPRRARREPDRAGHGPRAAPARTDASPLAHRDLCVASRPGLQRPDRGHQQPDQGHQARRVRVPPLPQLPPAGPALRRPPELGPARHAHALPATTLKSGSTDGAVGGAGCARRPVRSFRVV
jgi:transposase